MVVKCYCCNDTGEAEMQDRYTDGSYARSVSFYPCPECHKDEFDDVMRSMLCDPEDEDQ